MQADHTLEAPHYLPAGLESGGGIGRFVCYITDATRDGSSHAVFGTWGSVLSPARLIASIGAIAKDRFAWPIFIHHKHVAGRGSTIRKVILCAAARALGCTHVLHLHDYDYATDFMRRTRWQRALVRRMFQRANRMLALCQRDRTTVINLLGIDWGRSTLLGNCVPDRGPRAARHDTVATIVFLGEFGQRKGVPELIRALAAPEMLALPWRAVIAGDGPVSMYLEETDLLGLGSRVMMPGRIDRASARDLCSFAEIVVLTSHFQRMAIALIEALAHDLAVVTTLVGAHEEAMTDGVTGVFVDVGDPAGLAVALARLASEPADRERLSAAARAHYLARFGMEGYMTAIDVVYAGLADIARPERVAAEERST